MTGDHRGFTAYAPHNDGTDDAQAVAAIANAMSSGGTILLTAGGTYRWATPQRITAPGVTIMGAGWLQTADTAGSVLKAAPGWSSPDAMLTLAAEGCRLLGIQVSGSKLASNLIAVAASNCRLLDAGTRHPARGGACLHIQPDGASCWVTGGRYNGVADGSVGILVDGTDAIITQAKPVNQATGILLLSGASGAQLATNHITPGRTGGNCIWVSGSASNILIQGNRFDNTPISPVQLTPASYPHNIAITGNITQSAFTTGFPVIGYDTSSSAIRGLLITANTSYAVPGHVPTYLLDAITQAGAPAANRSRVTSGGTQVSDNLAYLVHAGFWGVPPTAGRANLVSTDGTTWAPVPEVGF